ncbi:MAG TPA: hypothetical protein VNF47_23225 [Streptosporangiaceae bacterium]|nr:hypothetical protein [Streptosporangiaceae bacterium]
MTGDPAAGPAVPNLVRIRLSGQQEDVARVAALLAEQGRAGGLTVLEVSAPCANRREPGVRVYVTALTELRA